MSQYHRKELLKCCKICGVKYFSNTTSDNFHKNNCLDKSKKYNARKLHEYYERRRKHK